MDLREENDLLQDYRYRKNILGVITEQKIENWDNASAGVGQKGDKGDTWKPSVDSEGNLAWTKDTSDNPPTTTNIKGPKGDKGDKGEKGDSATATPLTNTVSSSDTSYAVTGKGVSDYVSSIIGDAINYINR